MVWGRMAQRMAWPTVRRPNSQQGLDEIIDVALDGSGHAPVLLTLE